jgi:predicted Zn-dependent protease
MADLDNILIFVKVAQYESISRAARSLGMPISTVSRRLSVLESQLTIPNRIPQLVTHELGHVLGIGRHSDESRDLMYGGELSVWVPSRRDQATVQVLYQMRPEAVP